MTRFQLVKAALKSKSAPILRGSASFNGFEIRGFSVLQRPPPNYEGHVPLTKLERGALAVGSAIGSLFNPRRSGMPSAEFFPVTITLSISLRSIHADLIAALGEATAQPYFISRLHQILLRHPTGRRILRDRPRITSSTLSLSYLRTLPPNSVGRAYAAWLDREGVTPDTRDAVRYIDDEECAYVMQRYRECHDFYHAITGLPVMVEGEIALKGFEWANTGLPMTALSLAAIVRLKPAERRRMWETYLPWAFSNGWRAENLICVYWEEVLERDVDELRAELGIEKPPDLRETRRLIRERRRAEKEAKEARERVGGLMRD